jgi:hypothetical protein
MPDSHSEGRRGKSGITKGKSYYLPREIFTGSGQPDRESGNRLTIDVEKSAEGIVGADTSQRRVGGLTKH